MYLRNHIQKIKSTPGGSCAFTPYPPTKNYPNFMYFLCKKINLHNYLMCVYHACYTIIPCASYFYARAAHAANFCFMWHRIFLSFARPTNNSNNTHCCVLAPQAEVVFKKNMNGHGGQRAHIHAQIPQSFRHHVPSQATQGQYGALGQVPLVISVPCLLPSTPYPFPHTAQPHVDRIAQQINFTAQLINCHQGVVGIVAIAMSPNHTEAAQGTCRSLGHVQMP